MNTVYMYDDAKTDIKAVLFPVEQKKTGMRCNPEEHFFGWLDPAGTPEFDIVQEISNQEGHPLLSWNRQFLHKGESRLYLGADSYRSAHGAGIYNQWIKKSPKKRILFNCIFWR
tara:strand:- start:2384 stop:2725 length:342 start_codon:yes stop_codon:yes gene_type:complete